MRLGFVAGSIAAHAAVVCLAWRVAPVGDRSAAPPVSGLVQGTPSQEVEVAFDDQDAVRTAEPFQTSKAHSERTAPADLAESSVATPAPAPNLVARPAPRVTAPPKPASSRPAVPTSPAESDRSQPTAIAAPPAKPAAGDWLSEAEQLPDSETAQPASGAPKAPPRDVLVERLLAKERDRERLAARDEAERHAQARRPVQPSAPQPAERPPTSVGPTADSDSEGFGESRAHADLWVELTRWLPRAASSDHSWDRLPSNASYEFRIELITEAGKLVDGKALDSAPAPTTTLLDATTHLMSSGRFGGSKRASHRFELRIRLSMTEPRDLWIAHTTPDPPKPGVGSFIAPSGRRFDVWVSEAP